MKTQLLISFITLSSIACKGQNNYLAIEIEQSLRGGDGHNTVIIGLDSSTVNKIQSENGSNPIDTHTYLVEKTTVNYLSNLISQKCNSEFPVRKNSDGYSIVIFLIKKDGTQHCSLANRSLIIPYFKNLIAELEKSNLKKDKSKMIKEMQQIIDYATLPEYTNEANKK